MELDQVYELAREAADQLMPPSQAWRQLLDAVSADPTCSADLTPLRTFDIAAEIARVGQQVAGIIASDPLPGTVDTLSFGLFDATTDDPGRFQTGFYISGVSGYDPESPDSLCDPVYFPESRFLHSSLLDAIREVVDPTGDDESYVFETLTLAAAAILAKHSLLETPRTRLVVGFDAGDVIEVKTIDGA